MIRIQTEPFDAAAELSALAARAQGAGGIVSFTGLVRGDGVAALHLSHFPGFTEAQVEAMAADAKARFEVEALTIIHRTGSLAPREPIVFVAAAASHRRAAFDAVDYLMDRLKTDAAFWKKEDGPDGTCWIEARPADHEDRRRWEGGANVGD